MQQGYETFNSHTFQEYCHISLGMHQDNIVEFLQDNPTARVLDVGCGEAAALQELKVFCERMNYRGVTFYGLDQQQPKTFLERSGVTFVKADIATIDLSEHTNRFDLIISVNTLHYVKDKEQALNNIAQLLNPNGVAYISIEPYYFGPYGTQLFEGSNCCQWDEDYRNIIVKPSQNPVIINAEKFFAYAFPQQLESIVWRNKDGRQSSLPRFYDAKTKQGLIERDGLECVIGYATMWATLAFLNPRTPNLNGPEQCGTPGFRPFQFGVIGRVWLRQENLPPFAVIRILADRFLWDKQVVKENWRPPQQYLELMSHLFELHGGIYLAGPKKKELEDIADIEFYRGSHFSLSSFIAPKNIAMLAALLVFLAVMIKILHSMNPVSSYNSPRFR